MKNYSLVDAHCHLNNELLLQDHDLISYWKSNNYKIFINSIINKNELGIAIKGFTVLHTAGLHPYLYFQKGQDFNLKDLIGFADKKQIHAIGECGLDKRYDNFAEQEALLLEQLAIANEYELPVVFHCVGKYYELAKVIKNNFPKTKGILHGFKGNAQIIDNFKQFDIYFSISSRLFQPSIDNKTLQAILKTDRYVFETDIELQHYHNSLEVIKKYNSINDIYSHLNISNKSFDLIDVQYKSIKNLFSVN